MFLSHIHHLICANCVVFIYEVCFFIHIFFCVLFGTDRANPDDFFGCWYFSLLFMSVNVECQRWFQCEMCVCVYIEQPRQYTTTEVEKTLNAMKSNNNNKNWYGEVSSNCFSSSIHVGWGMNSSNTK